jgi:hypothetical protein
MGEVILNMKLEIRLFKSILKMQLIQNSFISILWVFILSSLLALVSASPESDMAELWGLVKSNQLTRDTLYDYMADSSSKTETALSAEILAVDALIPQVLERSIDMDVWLFQ